MKNTVKEFKFRYGIGQEGKLSLYEYFTLDQIERGGIQAVVEAGGEILSRDRYIGVKDKNKKEIYEHDLVKIDNKVVVIMWAKEYAKFTNVEVLFVKTKVSEINMDKGAKNLTQGVVVGTLREMTDNPEDFIDQFDRAVTRKFLADTTKE